jgi:hypothetical protein
MHFRPYPLERFSPWNFSFLHSSIPGKLFSYLSLYIPVSFLFSYTHRMLGYINLPLIFFSLRFHLHDFPLMGSFYISSYYYSYTIQHIFYVMEGEKAHLLRIIAILIKRLIEGKKSGKWSGIVTL